MEKIKTIVDRERLGSDYIESRQNFGKVLNEVNQLKPPVWKSAWFYGPVGMSVLAVVVSITAFDPPSSLAMKNSEDNPDYKELIAHVKSESKTTSKTAITYDNTSTLKELQEEVSDPSSPIKNKPVNTISNETVAKPNVTEEHTEEVKEDEKFIYKGNFPHINGVFNGDITLNQLLNGDGITSNPNLTIKEFSISYFDGNDIVSSNVQGNKIPFEIGSKIKAFNIGEMIYITNIKAQHLNGALVSMSSLNYVVQK
jgi:hypothetical protein